MHHRIRWLRLAVYVGLFTVVPLLVSYLLAQSTAALYVRSQVQANLDAQLNYIARSTRPTELYSGAFSGVSDDEVERWRRDVLAQQQGYWDAQQVWAASDPQISHSEWYCVFEAVCFPTRLFSEVTITGTPQRSYPAPAALYESVSWLLAGGSSRLQMMNTSFAAVTFDSAIGLSAGLAIFALLPVTFVLLPISRRRAKVRWQHIIRVTAYGAFIPFTALVLVALSLTLTVGQSSPLLHIVTVRLSWWIVPVASVLWWTAGIGCYLKMPRGAFIAIMMAFLSGLLMLSALYLLFPDIVMSWLLSW